MADDMWLTYVPSWMEASSMISFSRPATNFIVLLLVVCVHGAGWEWVGGELMVVKMAAVSSHKATY